LNQYLLTMTTLLTLPSEITIKIFTTVIVDSGDVPPQPVVLLLASYALRLCEKLQILTAVSPASVKPCAN
jgi:hypothetical protein